MSFIDKLTYDERNILGKMNLKIYKTNICNTEEKQNITDLLTINLFILTKLIKPFAIRM